MFVSFNGCYRN